MLLYRIASEARLADFTGRGASYLNGARWNKAGVPAIYFALSPATAMLELANYLPSPKYIPKNYRLGIYEYGQSGSLYTLLKEQLPQDWDNYPYPQSTQQLGSQYLNNPQFSGMIVPSAAVVGGLDSCVVLSPHTLSTNDLQLVQTHSQLYNPRLFQGL